MKSFKIKQKYLQVFIVVFVCIFVGYFLFNSLRSSLFFQNEDKINIVFYGQNTRFYSLGVKDNVNFLLNFFPDLEMMIPGQYGLYRIGALGKLVSLEKKPDLFQKTFSLNLFSFNDFYFYPSKSEIYYGKETKEQVSLPRWKDIFLSSSNVSFFNKIYLYFYFFGKNIDDFKELDVIYENNKGQIEFNQDAFLKKYQGFFYENKYRNERKNVQIIYTNDYDSSLSLSHLIEGEGVRVVDINKLTTNLKYCKIIENTDKNFSETSKALSQYFKCSLEKGKTEISDIIIELGDREKEWAIN